MGLSSSQGRLLMLTSRMSDIELNMTLVSQRKNKLAMSSEKAAKAYNEAMSNYKMIVNVTDTNEKKGYKANDISYNALSSMGYVLSDSKNNIYLKKDENGEWIIPKNLDQEEILSINSDGKAQIGKQTFNIKNGDEYFSNTETLENAIGNGLLFLIDTNKTKEMNENAELDAENSVEYTEMASDTNFEYVLDTSDDAQAESEYNYETARLSSEDTRLDLELDQLETQNQAVKKEYESVKEVIDQNIERTYKLFSKG